MIKYYICNKGIAKISSKLTCGDVDTKPASYECRTQKIYLGRNINCLCFTYFDTQDLLGKGNWM